MTRKDRLINKGTNERSERLLSESAQNHQWHVCEIYNGREGGAHNGKHALRTRMLRCSSSDEDVMHKYFGIKSNQCKPIRCDEQINLEQFVTLHGNSGYVIVSAIHSASNDATNTENNQSLLRQIKRSGFAFLPIYCRYILPNGSAQSDYEPAFIVFNHDGKQNVADFGTLRQYALKWCGDYAQRFVMVKAPGKTPVYVNAQGQEVKVRDEKCEHAPLQHYFISLRAEGGEDAAQIECYINPIPQNLNEMMRRGNEIYLWSVPPKR